MAIAGIKQVNHAYWLSNNTEYYDREKVRQILIRFASKVEAFDEMEPPFVPDIDEFMESEEE